VTVHDFTALRDEAMRGAALRDSYDHGERHWRAVARAGLDLAPKVDGCKPLIVLLFALFHDARRENEFYDPEHGSRGAELSRQLLRERSLLSEEDERLLYETCRDHNGAAPSENPTVGTCFDADRLNLWRVGITPDEALLSTTAAREPTMRERSRSFHDEDHSWDDLVARYLELSEAS
jgi:uncharacterized protein